MKSVKASDFLPNQTQSSDSFDSKFDTCLASDPLEKQKASHEISGFGELKRLLADYLYGSIESSSYSLSTLELEVLKYLMLKRICFSSRPKKNELIRQLKAEEVPLFLRQNPQKRRSQLLKRTIFIHAWKYNEERGVNVLQSCFGGNARLDYRCELAAHQGNMSKKYFDACFRAEPFLQLFLQTIAQPDFWIFYNKSSIVLYNKHVDEWLADIKDILANHSSAKEKALLSKLRFLPYKTTTEELIKAFKLKLT